MKVAILVPPNPGPGRPDQNDTFEQAVEVGTCLDTLGHQSAITEYLDHGERTMRMLGEIAPDVVFNLVEEVPEGADQVHLATALLDRLGVRYTGARTSSLAVLGDKRTMKGRLRAVGLPTIGELGEVPPSSTFIVKSLTEHGSLGLYPDSVVSGADAARDVIEKRTEKFGGEWFAELYVEGREFDISLLGRPGGPLILPVAEMVFNAPGAGPRIFDYASKWLEGSAEAANIERVFPAREPLFEKLDALAAAAWRCFDLTGFCHVDFRVDAAGNPFILELNANPCIGRRAGFCDAANQAGLTQTDVVAALLAAA